MPQCRLRIARLGAIYRGCHSWIGLVLPCSNSLEAIGCLRTILFLQCVQIKGVESLARHAYIESNSIYAIICTQDNPKIDETWDFPQLNLDGSILTPCIGCLGVILSSLYINRKGFDWKSHEIFIHWVETSFTPLCALRIANKLAKSGDCQG